MKASAFGGLWFVYGILRIVMAVLLVVFSGTARLMAGAVLTRVPHPLAWMSTFVAFYWLVIAWCVVCAILSFLAAGMLLVESRPAAKVATIVAYVSLPEIPFGLLLGTYTLLRLHAMPAADTERTAARV
jgi:hypothetical protein